MGKNKNKHKNKSSSPACRPSPPKVEFEAKADEETKQQVLSEADAAAGSSMMIQRKEKEENESSSSNKTKRSRGNDEEDDNNNNNAKQQRPPQPKLSRKQKRQKLNEKNKWPQHPKITDSEQRSRAYLRVAGIEPIPQEDSTTFELDEKKSSTTLLGKKTVPPPSEDTDSSEKDDTEWRKFGRFLGGTDARTRHRAVQRLGKFLQVKSGYGLQGDDLEKVVGLSELDLLKLWKGLWFTLYMADKVPVQDELAKQIAKLVWCVAGDFETDEFAAQAYLDMEDQEEQEQEQQMELDNNDGDDDDEQQQPDVDEEEDDEEDDFKILETRVVDGTEEESDDEDDEEEDAMEEDNDQEDNEQDQEDNYEENPQIRGAPLAMLFMRTFFRTLVREWGNMDKYRVDKFYTLVRYMVREIYRYMAKRQWSLGIVRLFNDAITEEALIKPPNGVRYHLIDIALEELVTIATSSAGSSGKEGNSNILPLTEAIFLDVMEPYFNMAQHGFGEKTVQARVMEKVLERFLLQYSVVRDDNDNDDNNKTMMLEEVHVGSVSKFIFEMASTEETLDIHRKSLYEMHKTYERQRKKTGRDINIDMGMSSSSLCQEVSGEEEEEEEMAQQEEPVVVEHDDDSQDESEKIKETKKDKKKKDKKKKKKHKKHDDKGENDDKEEEATSSSSSSSAGTPEVSWKRGKPSTPKNDDLDTTHHKATELGESSSSSSKKKKEKKHKKKKKEEEEDATAGGEEDVVTISITEQKKAKEASKQREEADNDDSGSDSDDEKAKKKKNKKKKKSKKKDKKDNDDDDDAGAAAGIKKRKVKRRVSFDNHNKARSYKASMQGLRHLDPSESISKTPEKSILLNKGKKSPINNRSNSTPRKRNRATDYF